METDSLSERLWKFKTMNNIQNISYVYYSRTLLGFFNKSLPFKDEAQTAFFKDPVRTAL
jgi:hypothetical protein